MIVQELLNCKAGWYSDKKLDFHPTNPGSTSARVNYHKKRDQNHLVCLNNDRELQGVLKISYQAPKQWPLDHANSTVYNPEE